MSSSNSPDKNISGRDDETTAPDTTDATAGTRPTDTPSPYFRDYRKRHASPSTPEDSSALIRALSGLLHTLVRVEDTQAVIETPAVSENGGAAVDESVVCRERTASKGEYGSRAEPVDGVYGYTAQGDPWKFYGLTDDGRAFLEEHNLLTAEETLQQIYDTISDKPEKMGRYENAPRPEEQ